MQTQGFGESPQASLGGDPKVRVGQVRRIAGIGPAYEVLKLLAGDRALIHVFESGEEVALKIEDVANDPISETIP